MGQHRTTKARRAPSAAAVERDSRRERYSAYKPNLFIVGAPKCGTTAWARYLSSHPDIFFSAMKEPHYFSPDIPKPEELNNFATEEQYLSLFAKSGGAKIVAEGSTRYLQSRVASENISRFNPDAKIIIFVRDQEDYLPSLHNHLVWRDEECIKDFETAWRLSGKRDATNISPHCRGPEFVDYVSLGTFSKQVDRYFKHFPEAQIRVFHFNDWSKNPRATYLEILRFLGIPDDGRTEFPQVNAAKRHRTKWVWRLVNNPPRLGVAATRSIKRITGLHTLHLVDFLRWADSKKGAQTRAGDEVKQEIAEHFKSDNALLQSRICRPTL